MESRFTPLAADDPRTVAGYTLRARLGSGGMGRVYLSFTPGGRPIAIKVVRPEYADDQEFRRRFRREVTAAQRVQGTYTAPVIDADTDAPLPWLATAYVAGPSLQQAVQEYGPLPPLTVVRLLAGVAEALTAIHQAGLIHRDLKPANVLLADDGPRVIDFGIAHAADATSATRTGVRVGTPAYMAPEQVLGQPVTPATDVFCLGHLTFYAATGRTAFGEGPEAALFYRIQTMPPDLTGCPPELHDMIERCLAKDPADRPALNDIIEYAREQMAGRTMELAGSWLPDTIAAGLDSFRTTVPPDATMPRTPPPPTRTPTQPAMGGPTMPAAPPHRPVRPAYGRRPARPATIALALGALVVLAAGAAVVNSLSGSGSGSGPAHSSRTHDAPGGGTGTGRSSAPAGPAYPQEFRDVAFTLPGGDCFTQSVQFTGQGPQVQTDVSEGLEYVGCESGPPELRLGVGQQMAEVTGTPDGASCATSARRNPLPGGLNFFQLHEGLHLCLIDSTNDQVVLLKVTSRSKSSYALRFTATAWSMPSGN